MDMGGGWLVTWSVLEEGAHVKLIDVDDFRRVVVMELSVLTFCSCKQ